jgi:hypothetical protein
VWGRMVNLNTPSVTARCEPHADRGVRVFRWYPLVPAGTRWYPLVPVGTRWARKSPALGTGRMTAIVLLPYEKPVPRRTCVTG